MQGQGGRGARGCPGQESGTAVSLQGLLGGAERAAGGERADGRAPGPGGAAGQLRSAGGAAELLEGGAEQRLPLGRAGPQRHQSPGRAAGPGGSRYRLLPPGCHGQGRAPWGAAAAPGGAQAGLSVPVPAGTEVPLDPPMLLGVLDDGALCKEVVVALERQLCSQGPVPSGQVAQLLQDHGCFQLLLRSLELLGTEKAVSLRILRWVQGTGGSGSPSAGVGVLLVMLGTPSACLWALVGCSSLGTGSPQHTGRC